MNKEAFIRLALDHRVLQFGQFTLKSGRQSPYFFNMGLFYTGDALMSVGEHYAQLLLDNQIECRHLFGPAYKGIPLATATSIALARRGFPTQLTFNRKEAKDHGEGGVLIGAPLQGEIVMIDDVITAGTAFRQAQALIRQEGADLSTVMVALDRCERGGEGPSAFQEIKATGIRVLSIISIYDLIDYLDIHHESEKTEMLRVHLEEQGRMNN